jgi:hypothetical protein
LFCRLPIAQKPAYIIIEVTNNLAIHLHLPYWFGSLELLILVSGVPVAVILSWVFDFSHQGIKKTESLEESNIKEPLQIIEGIINSSQLP